MEYIDKQGYFKDFSFKLVVLEELLKGSCSFYEEVDALVKTGASSEEFLDFFSNVELSDEDLDAVKELHFDAEDEIYVLIDPKWDGRDDVFRVRDISGIEHLKNVELIEYIDNVEVSEVEKLEKMGYEII
ncbi:DUF6892 domain-containing protein [Guggenheimella bovis]